MFLHKQDGLAQHVVQTSVFTTGWIIVTMLRRHRVKIWICPILWFVNKCRHVLWHLVLISMLRAKLSWWMLLACYSYHWKHVSMLMLTSCCCSWRLLVLFVPMYQRVVGAAFRGQHLLELQRTCFSCLESKYLRKEYKFSTSSFLNENVFWFLYSSMALNRISLCKVTSCLV